MSAAQPSGSVTAAGGISGPLLFADLTAKETRGRSRPATA